jgi:hypothetical protein
MKTKSKKKDEPNRTVDEMSPQARLAAGSLAGAHSVAYRLFMGYGTADRDDARMLLDYCRCALEHLGMADAVAIAEQEADRQYGFTPQQARQFRKLRDRQADIDEEIFRMGCP